ncbi:ROK family transcriptional regulator [Actinomadura opuntiae]|uniref:ROK family transcriptional regulator n=1 Tax=Actinomadura sp. OS1-43 TaxID=604315 RepID=UPI00255B23B3|nr:ROK family transcriptional regulator [Actinomadura sp. OS1-43]MDL4813427.1 ROK family transcriptional regulator [Actinomadura sp. OS1-43]
MASPRNRSGSPRARDARWRGALAVLDEMRRDPGATRVAVARRLGLSTGSATEITARLRDLALLAEAPAAAAGRGRPTTALVPHPDGPLVIAVDLRHEDWRCAVAALDGRPEIAETGTHRSRDPGHVIDAVAAAVGRLHRRHGARVRAVSVAVAATVQRGRVVQSSVLGWDAVDLTALAAPAADPRVPLLIGNDATLAGLAEARQGAAAGAATVLHVTVEVGVGGTLVVDGLPVDGATGAGGEFGHLPFGDPGLRCPCGASGCWDLVTDGRAIARHLGDPPPRDPRTYADRALARAPADPAVRTAVARTATGLARGVAGLINALDPGVVTLGGLAESLRAAAEPEFAAALTGGLMRFRRPDPPPVVAAALGRDGALHGAVVTALDHVLTEDGLAAWASLRSPG